VQLGQPRSGDKNLSPFRGYLAARVGNDACCGLLKGRLLFQGIRLSSAPSQAFNPRFMIG